MPNTKKRREVVPLKMGANKVRPLKMEASRGIRFDDELWGEVTDAAKEDGRTPSDWIRRACHEKLTRGVTE